MCTMPEVMEKDETRPIKRILFVDGDNKFESAVAEALTRDQAAKRGADIEVSSVGVHAPNMAPRRLMTREQLERADLIIVLHSRYVDDVKAMLPQNQWHKIALFHLYCLGDRSKEFPEHALLANEQKFYPEFERACINLITRTTSIPCPETFEERNLNELRKIFIEKYSQQLVDGFTEQEIMVTANHNVMFRDGVIWLRLLRYGSAYSLDVMIKDEHNASFTSIAYGSLYDIRRALYSETFARDNAKTLAKSERSYKRLLTDPR